MSHHAPFKALGPISWSEVTDQAAAGSLPGLRATALASAQTLVDSVPGAASTSAQQDRSVGSPARARSSTDPDRHIDAEAERLRHEWKPVRVSNNNNNNNSGNGKGKGMDMCPDMAVYRLASKDGRGAWFARRSVHLGGRPPFERWRAGLEGEFEETLRRARDKGGEPGTGNIRGIGAERLLEEREGLKVFQVSTRFPGPTAPRDFVPLLLTSNEPQGGDDHKQSRRPRQFMVVSKPCTHPDCPPRQGFVRGQYESVEVVREIPVDKPLRRVRSSIDVGSRPFDGDTAPSDSDDLGKDSVRQSAKHAASDTEEVGGPDGGIASIAGKLAKHSKSEIDTGHAGDEQEMAIEWIMITRSDPGGSVPRFMVEKGTPPGIVNDAGRLLRWLSEEESKTPPAKGPCGDAEDEEAVPPLPPRAEEPTTADSEQSDQPDETRDAGPGGIYGMITSALEAAGSVVVRSLNTATDSEDENGAGTEDGSEDEDDTSSFASAEESHPRDPTATVTPLPEPASSSLSMQSNISSQTPSAGPAPAPSSAPSSQHDKALRKLQDRHRKTREKTIRAHERALAKRREDEARDAQAAAKLRERHEKEIAKQEDKYRRELRKLEEKREKAAEREDKAGLLAELERVRSERDVAVEQAEMLRGQVGELQAQNTLLVARLGKIGGLDGGAGGGEASLEVLGDINGQAKTAKSR